MSTERLHHPYSPSSLQNLEACPCFQNHNSTNEAAIRGTLAHKVAETGEDDQSLEDEHAMHAADCMDFVERMKTLLIEEQQRAQATSEVPLAEVLDLTEPYLPVDDCVFEEPLLNPETNQVEDATISSTTGGYADRILISWDRRRATLVDFKFGNWAAEKADNNVQGIAYSLGVFWAYPAIESVRVFFKFPALDLVTEATFTRSQVPDLYLRIQTIVARAREARAMVSRGNDFSFAAPATPLCQFCANLGRCPKVAAIALKVGSKFHALEIPSDIDPTGIKSAEDVALGLRLSQVLAVWAKAYRAQITERVICRGAEMPPGFKLQSRADRKIVDGAKFKKIALRWLTAVELEKLATYSFGDVEEVISAAAPRGSKKAELESFKKALFDSGAVKLGDSYSFLKGFETKD